MKKRILILLILSFIHCFAAKTTDYIDKTDVENSKKIFINQKQVQQQQSQQSQPVQTTQPSTQQTTQQKLPEEITIKMTLGYINPEKIAEKLNGFNGVKITGFENSVIMRGTKENLLEIGKIIQILDKPKKQVIIKANIIDTSNNLFDRLGVDWSLGLGGATNSGTGTDKGILAKIVSGELSLSALLTSNSNFLGVDIAALKEKGDIKIEAMPTLMILEEEEGELKVTEEVIVGEKTVTSGTKEYTEPIFSEAGIVFKVTPEVKIVGDEEKILLKVDMEISNFKLTSSYSESEGAKQKNQTKTVVLLNNGGSTFVGGLKQNVGKESTRKVPLLSNIPIIGAVFKYKATNKEVREIYIEIEALVVDDKEK